MKLVTVLLFALLTLLAACSGDPVRETAAATEAPGSPAPAPTAPDQAGAGDLAAVLPTEVDGITIEYRSRSGASVVSSGGELTAEAQEFVDALEADMSDFSTASGVGFDEGFERNVAITALRVAGADEGRLRDAFRRTIENDPSQVLTEATVGGKSVLSVAGDDGETTGYLYVKGDIVFVVGGQPLSVADEALAQLP